MLRRTNISLSNCTTRSYSTKEKGSICSSSRRNEGHCLTPSRPKAVGSEYVSLESCDYQAHDVPLEEMCRCRKLREGTWIGVV